MIEGSLKKELSQVRQQISQIDTRASILETAQSLLAQCVVTLESANAAYTQAL